MRSIFYILALGMYSINSWNGSNIVWPFRSIWSHIQFMLELTLSEQLW